MKQTQKQDKGVAGLTILLSLVVMLFIIGLIVMIFSLMGSSLSDATYTVTTTAVVNETVVPTTAGTNLAVSSYRNVACGTVVCRNATNGQSSLAGNFTQTNCAISNDSSIVGLSYRCSYSYTWDESNTATDVMNDTTSGISGVTDWFDIFIVIGAMVVLILLTVIIITAIRSSGMVDTGSTQEANQIGTA